jgi:hypothetical protein
MAAKGREAAAATGAMAAEASERVGRLERGDDVPGGLSKPIDFESAMREAGFTKGELRHMAHVTEAADAFGLERVIEALWKPRAGRSSAPCGSWRDTPVSASETRKAAAVSDNSCPATAR